MGATFSKFFFLSLVLNFTAVEIIIVEFMFRETRFSGTKLVFFVSGLRLSSTTVFSVRQGVFLRLVEPCLDCGFTGGRARGLYQRRVGLMSCSTIGEGGDTTIPSPGRSPKQPLPGMGLHAPLLHGRQACPNSTHSTRGLVKYFPVRGYYRAVPSKTGTNLLHPRHHNC